MSCHVHCDVCAAMFAAMRGGTGRCFAGRTCRDLAASCPWHLIGTPLSNRLQGSRQHVVLLLQLSTYMLLLFICRVAMPAQPR
jgi:hypothetical protein